MTSTTLSFKSNFAPAFKKTFKQGLLNFISELVLAVLVSVIAIMITFSNYVDQYYVRGEVDITLGAMSVLGIMTVICGFSSLSLAPKMFKEIYKKQSCDMYFSLPIKRRDYYTSAYLLGVIVNVTGLVLSCALYAGIMPAFSNKNVQFTMDLGAFMPVFIAVLMALLAIYSAFVMCAVTAGKKIQYFLLALICLFCTSSALTGVLSNLNQIWGLSVDGFAVMAFDPMNNAINAVFAEGMDKMAALYIVSAIEIVGMFFAGLIIFEKRKAEVAEVTLTGKIIPYILLVDLAVASYMYFSGTGAVSSIILGIICAVLITMAFSGIFYKKVFTKKTGVTVGAVCLACTVFISCVYFPGHSSYVKKVPDASQVESIEISNVSVNSIYLSVVTNLLSEYDLDTDVYSTITVTGEKAIADTIALHQKLVDDNVIEKSQSYTNYNLLTMLMNSSVYDDYYGTYDVRLTYHLKSGKTLSRTYSAVTNLLLDEYVQLMKNEELLSQIAPFNVDEENFLYATVDTEYGDYFDENYDDAYEGQYYGQIIDIESFNDFKKDYISEIMQFENKNFADVLCEIDGSFYYENYDYNYNYSTIVASVEIYTIDPTASDEVKEKLRSMTPAQIDSIMYSYEDEESFELYNAVVRTDLNIVESQTDTINNLKASGVKFPGE